MCSRRFVLFAILASSVALAEPAPTWETLSFYEHPIGTHNAVLRNASETPQELDIERVTRASDDAPVHTWWIRATPSEAEPGGHTIVQFALKRAKSRPGAVRLLLRDDTRIALTPTPAPVLPVYCVEDSKQIFTYWRNASESDVSLTEVRLFSGDRMEREPLELRAQETGLWTLATDDQFHSGTLTTFHLKTSAGESLAVAPVFHTDDFELRWEHEGPELMVCPTHRHGSWDVVGRKIFSWQAGTATPPATVHFCRNRLPAGLGAFAACVPRALVNLQASNLTRGHEAPWPGWFDIADLTRAATEPGAFLVLLEDASLYGGAYGKLASPDDPPLRDQEIRPLAYLSLASGAKGLLLRPPARAMQDTHRDSISSVDLNAPREDERRRFERLLDELRPLNATLSNAAPLTPVDAHDTDAYWLRALHCGEDSLFVVAYSKSPAPVSQAHDFIIHLRPPADMPPLRKWQPHPSGKISEVTRSDSRYQWRATTDADGLAIGFLTP